MAQRMVMVKNMMNCIVSVKDTTYNINRRWNKRGQVLPIPFEVVEGMLWSDSFRRMIDSGILYIENMQDKKDLGLEPQDATEPVNIKALSEMQMENLLTKTPISVFKREVQDLPMIQVDNLIDYAIANRITDAEKCAFLKLLTKKDILAAISAEEDDRAAEEKEKARREFYAQEGRRG